MQLDNDWGSDYNGSCISSAFGYGLIAIGLAFIAGSMGGVLQAAVAVTFAVAGPLYAAFNLAIFVPFSNAKVSWPKEHKYWT